MPRFTRFLAVSAAITLAVLCLAIPAFSQKTYVAGFATNKVYYFNPIMGSQTVIDLPGNPFDVVITTDGLTAYVSCLYGNTVAVIDVTTNNISATIETPLTPSRLAIGNSESRLYVANQSLTAPHLTVVDITKRKGARLNKVVAQLDLNAYVPGADTAYAVATYHNAVAKKDLMAVGTISGHVLLFDTTNKGITYKGHWYVGIGVSDLVFSKDGTKLYFVLLGGGIDGNLLVADVASFTVSKGLVLGDSSNPLGSGVLNGKTLYVTGPADSKFYKINTATDTLAGTVPLPAGSTPFDIAAFNLGAAQGGLTLFMTDTAHSQLDTFSKKTLGVITLEPGATPYGIAVTTKNWQPKIGYTITDLGTLGGDSSKAMAVNASGQVAGHSTLAGNSIVHAFLYSSGVMQDLGALSGTNSFAWGINTSGQVVGMWQLPGFNGYHSFLYSGGVMQDLGTLGGTSSWANGINDSGQIVGVFFDGAYHSFLLNMGTVQDLGTLGGTSSWAYGINDSGQIVGLSLTLGDTATHAFLYSAGVMQDLGTLGGTNSSAAAINSSGQIAGASDITGDAASHASLYRSGTLIDLGTLGGTNSQAHGINALGQVVGSSDTSGGSQHAMLFSGKTMQDLNSLIPQDSGWLLTTATDINDSGQIVGEGLINGHYDIRAFLLTPLSTTN